MVFTEGVMYAKGLVDSGLDIFSQTVDGAKKTVGGAFGTASEELNKLGLPEVPEWMHNIMKFGDKEGKNSGNDGGPEEDPKKPAYAGAAAGAATAAAFGYGAGDDERTKIEQARDDQMMVLTRKMIEIRNILQRVGQTGALQLPSIVVIGSQSSGKSSVLEAIVGHEFLPKGANMVTRRPIELTLINTPGQTAEYGEFPALNIGKITDFSRIQATLTDLNLAVSEEDCVSDDPIQLNIYSPHVPDLSLIDLPGYIQVTSEGQPPELKQKIVDLCEKYIRPPNVILAISAADVDLANSTALRASRRVDPRGERTIGVITKMDLVEPSRGYAILKDKNYPLRLGYVGVVCRTPTAGYFRKNANISSAIIKNENSYFSQHPEFSPESGALVGTQNLRQKLMSVLEQTMASSLQGTSDAIHQELEEATYEFKVQYNDRPLTAETYLAESLDRFKHSFKDFTHFFGRPQVRELLKRELDQKVLDFLAQRYWNKPYDSDEIVRPRRDDRPLSELPTADPENMYWQRKLDASTSQLTKLGFGRLATNVVANALSQHMDRLVEESTFRTHPFAKKAIADATNTILNERFYSTSDQVENCIKPYKYEIEVEDREWEKSRENASRLLKDELRQCEEAFKGLQGSVGKKKLQQVMGYVDKVKEQQGARVGGLAAEGTEAFGFSQALVERGEYME